jgi:hypothetical protein
VIASGIVGTVSRPRGRPTKPTVDTIDPVVMDMARELLADAARSRRAYRAAPAGPFRDALLAVRLSEALDALATGKIQELRRADDSVTWADVSEAFETTPQSAHARFR